MLLILQADGFEIKDRELTRVRHNNSWRLRVANNAKAQPADEAAEDQPGKNNKDIPIAPELEQAECAYPTISPGGDRNLLATTAATRSQETRKRPASEELSPEVQAKRRARLEKLEAESVERYQQRTRRRRTKEWAGLPADPPGPPRFPSETTIEESKVLLNLDDDTYRHMRNQFQQICNDHGVVKKTQAGPEQWLALKNQLISENAHLQTVFYVGEGADLRQQYIALDVICSDVTKRIRTLRTRVTIADAKNEMGVDPEQARDLRKAFYAILKADHFTSKLEAGEEHWKELKDNWIAESPLLQRILGAGDADPDHAAKVKATEVLCRDVMKRLRDDQTKQDPDRIKRSKAIGNIDPSIRARVGTTSTIDNGEGSSMGAGMNNDHGINNGMNNGHDINGMNNGEGSSMGNRIGNSMNNNHGITNGIATLASQALASAQSNQDYDGQIDPTLLFAANAPTIEMPHQPDLSYHQPPPHNPITHPTPIFFRLSPFSHLQSPPTLWLETLPAPPTIRALHALAVSKHGAMATGNQVRVSKIEGVVKVEVGAGEVGEVKWTIEEDDELVGYLGHVGAEKATFVVGLVEG